MPATFLLQDYEDDNRQSLLEKLLFPVKKMNPQKLAAALRGKTILITGASYGIGASLVQLCSRHAAKIVMVARTAERLKALQASGTDKAAVLIPYILDLREEKEVTLLLEYLEKENIQVDIFINNAGKSIYRKLSESVDRFHDTRRCAATNYTGPVQLLLGLLPGLTARKGHVINVSAVNVLLPPAVGWSAYQSSKAAYDQWLRCAEPEMKAKDICVSSIYLPLVRTRMSMVNAKKHTQPAMPKAKAVQLIGRYLYHKKRKYKPWWLGIVQFMAGVFPHLFYHLQVRKIRRS